MSRTGAESKPQWRQIPEAIRADTEQSLGAGVTRARRVWGGYGPSVTFRLQLAGGRRAFFKGINETSNEVMRGALEHEERVYHGLADIIRPWAPAFYGSFRRGHWHVLLLEDLGPASVPPWTQGKARAAMRAYADFHGATLDKPLPGWLPRHAEDDLGQSWGLLAAEAGGLEAAAALAGARSDEALRWLQAAMSPLDEAAVRVTRLEPPHTLLHLDTRSDNIRLTGGRLRLFDWPYAAVGPPEVDVAAFAQSIVCEGGPDAEQLVAWYGERLPLRETALDAAVAAIAGFFAVRAWRPDIPGLPRLRSIQRCQLRASLAWAARRLGLPEPAWLAAVRP